MARLSGKVALITGAGSGMGAADARLFGAEVIVTERHALRPGVRFEHGARPCSALHRSSPA